MQCQSPDADPMNINILMGGLRNRTNRSLEMSRGLTFVLCWFATKLNSSRCSPIVCGVLSPRLTLQNVIAHQAAYGSMIRNTI